MAILVNCEEEVALWRKTYPRNVRPVREGKCIGFVAKKPVRDSLRHRQRMLENLLDEVEDCHPVSYRRIQVGALWVEQKIALAVDRSKEVRELEISLHL